MNFNRVILAGNLTRDPQVKYLSNGTAVCEFGLAVNEKRKERETVLFVDVAAFGVLGETIHKYLAKGRSALIEGRLKHDAWTAKDGSKRTRLSVVADAVQFGPGRQHDDDGDDRRAAVRGGAHSPPPVDAPHAPVPLDDDGNELPRARATPPSRTSRTTYRDGGFHPAEPTGPNYIDEALAAAGREPVALADAPPLSGDDIPF